jgi:iron complex outermembrane receptor protein
VQIVRNLDAEAFGGELELFVTPVEGLDLMLGAAWLDSTVENVGLPSGEFVDRNLPMASDFTFNGMARYEWPIGSSNLAVQGDFRYVDDFCFTLVCNHTEVEDGYLLANARVSLDLADDRWTLTGFVNNLTDEEYRINALDVSSVGFTVSVPAPPRWFGISATYRW